MATEPSTEPADPQAPDAEGEAQAELTIDELARETGMTARNIRAHQSRGLLPPPTVRARTGYYTPDHVARIRLIQDMQAQGFNLKAIQRLLDLNARTTSESALAFERTILRPFSDEQPEVITAAELAATFGDQGDAKTLRRAEKIGAIRPLGDGTWEVPSPTLLRAARELVELGIPLHHALAVGDAVRRHTTAIAREFVRLFVKDVFEPLREGEPPGDEGLERVRETAERLRPLASEAVIASFSQVMTEAVEQAFERELAKSAGR